MDPRTALQSALGGAYRVDRELSGGTRHVCLATELASARPVVITIVPGHEPLERVRPAFDAARELRHPNIIPLLACGAAEDFLYSISAPASVESLRARVRRAGEMPVGDAVIVVRDVARALSYAHGRGIVHGDLRPDVIFFTGHAATVADVGVAPAFGASPAPAYAAPNADPADPRNDLYALGVVAYEILTGAPPFVARGAAQLVQAHASEAPAPITARRPATPPALAALVNRLLAKQPDDRPQSADEVLHAVAAIRVSSGERVSPPVPMARVSGARPNIPRLSVDPLAELRRKLRRRIVVASAVLAVLLAGAMLVTCPRRAAGTKFCETCYSQNYGRH